MRQWHFRADRWRRRHKTPKSQEGSSVYNGTTLSETITDLVTNATFTTSYVVDIPSKVVPGSSNIFYVGFTGGTGGLAAIQEVLTWTLQQVQ